MNEKTNKRLTIVPFNNLYEVFHENTKQFFLDEKKKIENPLYPILWKKIHYKSYPRFKTINLSDSEDSHNLTFKAMKNRRSIREFNGKSISLEQVSELLLYGAGISYNKNGNWDESYRTYPSAGARYSLELYPVSINVKNLKRGVYHYNVKNHSLELIRLGNLKSKIIKYTNNQKWINESALVILISSIFQRTIVKYGNRGYRYVFLDVGHLAQNIYLAATQIGLGCCAIGGFLDNEINNLLYLDGIKESVIYVLVVGGTNKA